LNDDSKSLLRMYVYEYVRFRGSFVSLCFVDFAKSLFLYIFMFTISRSEWKSRSEIKERLDAMYGDSSPLMAIFKNWFNEF